jgi:hypothetical protein
MTPSTADDGKKRLSSHRISMRIPTWLHDKLVSVCADEQLSMTSAIVRAIEQTYMPGALKPPQE